MKLRIPNFLKKNLLLKMTSLNAGVIVIRLIVAVFLNREITDVVGKTGYAKIGNLRNLLAQLQSLTSLGVFNGIIKYVSEHKEDKEQLQKLFSTTFVFTLFGSIVTFAGLFFGAEFLSTQYFNSPDYTSIIKVLAVVVPFISIQRVFNGVVNGLSKYKSFAKIELFAYLLSAVLMLVLLFQYGLDGALIAIAITPAIQVMVMLFVFVKVLREYVQFSKLQLKIPFAKSLLAFTAMSFFSTLLLNQVEIEVRNMITDKINEAEAGVWTGMLFISKNYMVFSNALFTLYVIPKFAGIKNKFDFTVELKSIYKTLLPIFGLGMLAIYPFRNLIIDILFQDDFSAMAPLFKWQLMGDFVRLGALVLAHQFVAKKLVRAFIFTELISLGLFFIFSYFLVDLYGIEGVPMAHFFRFIIYFVIVFFMVMRYFRKQPKDLDLEQEKPSEDAS